MVFGWLINFFKSIFGMGGKDVGALGRDEAKLESEKSQLRIIQDKLRAEEAKTQQKEMKGLGKEIKELGNISRGEPPKAEEKDVMRLVIGDKKIRKKLRKKKRLEKKVQGVGKIIEVVDTKEERDEAKITKKTGRRSSRTAQLKQDTQVQERVIQSQEKEKQNDTVLLALLKQKEACEKRLISIDEELKGNIAKKIQTDPRLANERAQLKARINKLEQKIINYKQKPQGSILGRWAEVGPSFGKRL